MTREIVRDPLYMQVAQALVELMRTEFNVGDQFLTERQVSERFGISRTTANKALSNLVIDGALEFRTGIGTFVRPAKPSVNLRRLISFTQKADEAGMRPETRVTRFRTVTLNEVKNVSRTKATAVLQADGSLQVHEMSRLRLLNDVPVIFERRVLRAAPCPELSEVATAGSLYTLLSDSFGLSIAGVAQRIRARILTKAESSMLGIPESNAVLELAGVGYLTSGDPLWYEETIYRGDTYEFVNQLRTSGDENQSSLGPRGDAKENERLWYFWKETDDE